MSVVVALVELIDLLLVQLKQRVNSKFGNNYSTILLDYILMQAFIGRWEMHEQIVNITYF